MTIDILKMGDIASILFTRKYNPTRIAINTPNFNMEEMLSNVAESDKLNFFMIVLDKVIIRYKNKQVSKILVNFDTYFLFIIYSTTFLSLNIKQRVNNKNAPSAKQMG